MTTRYARPTLEGGQALPLWPVALALTSSLLAGGCGAEGRSGAGATSGALEECTVEADCAEGETCHYGTCRLTCTVHHDCNQGDFCYNGMCVNDPNMPIYHCGKDGCPPGEPCVTIDGERSTCREDPDYVCTTACDCGPAHACVDIDRVGWRCVKDVDDPAYPGGYAIYDATIPPGSPTYCCEAGACLLGRDAYQSSPDHDVGDFACYDPYTEAPDNYCGGAPCRFVGDCRPGLSCVDVRMTEPVPGAVCHPEGGKCVSNAVAESHYGYAATELWPACHASLPPGTACVAGWAPGGPYAFEQVLATAGSCGDGVCGPGEFPDTCADCVCGDGVCDPVEIQVCAADCGTCRDGECNGLEAPKTCGNDCTVICGDGSCDPSEVTSCPADCPCEGSATFSDFPSVCGDGYCHPESPEDCLTCPDDCGEPGVDADGDGTPDCADGCPEDPAKTSPGECGCGAPEEPGCGTADAGTGDGGTYHPPSFDCTAGEGRGEPGAAGWLVLLVVMLSVRRRRRRTRSPSG